MSTLCSGELKTLLFHLNKLCFEDFVEAEKDNNLNAPQSSKEESLKEKDELELSEKAESKLLYQRCHSDNFNEPNIKPDLQKSLADIQTSMAGLTSEMKIKLFKKVYDFPKVCF